MTGNQSRTSWADGWSQAIPWAHLGSAPSRSLSHALICVPAFCLSVVRLVFARRSEASNRNLPTHAGVPHGPAPGNRLGRSACCPFREPGGPPPTISSLLSVAVVVERAFWLRRPGRWRASQHSLNAQHPSSAPDTSARELSLAQPGSSRHPSAGLIAAQLNARPVPTQSSAIWEATTVRMSLTGIGRRALCDLDRPAGLTRTNMTGPPRDTNRIR